MEYTYELVLEESARAGCLRPDFSFIDPAGELIVWEHLEMLACDDY